MHLTERQIIRVVVRSFLAIALLMLIGWFAWTVRSVLVLILLAVVLATGLGPVVDVLTGANPPRTRFRMARSVATLLIYLVLILALTLLVVGFVPAVANQAESLVVDLPIYYSQLLDTARYLGQTYPFLANLDQQLSASLNEIAGNASAIFGRAGSVLRLIGTLLSGLLSIIFLLVLTYYLIQEGDRVRGWLIWLLPEDSRALASSVAVRAQARIGSWLVGQFALSLIIGSMSFVGLSIIGVPYALLLAAIAAIGEVIPIIGPIIAAVPAIIIALFVSPLTGLLTLGLAILVQQLENNLIVPQVMRRAVDLSPVVVLAAIMIGSEALGVVGAILALPVAATISIVVDELLALRDHRKRTPPG